MEGMINKVAKFLKKEYKIVTGNSLSLSPEGEAAGELGDRRAGIGQNPELHAARLPCPVRRPDYMRSGVATPRRSSASSSWRRVVEASVRRDSFTAGSAIRIGQAA